MLSQLFFDSMTNKLTYIHDCFLRNSITMQGNVFVFCSYQRHVLSNEKVNQLYCYVRYCSIYKKSFFFYNSRAGRRYRITKTEFHYLIKLTNLLNNFNFEKYNYFAILKLINRYVFGLIYG